MTDARHYQWHRTRGTLVVIASKEPYVQHSCLFSPPRNQRYAYKRLRWLGAAFAPTGRGACNGGTMPSLGVAMDTPEISHE